ncbi:hypothetical protein PENTCL1PPCAC_23111, partial [Pristionchus entomophagus]
PPNPKETSKKASAARAAPLPTPIKRGTAARVVRLSEVGTAVPSKTMADEAAVETISASTLLSRPRQSLPPSSSISHPSPSSSHLHPSDTSDTLDGSARSRPFRPNPHHPPPFSPYNLPIHSLPRSRPFSIHPMRRLSRPSREIHIIAPSLDPDEPIRLPHPSSPPPPPSSDPIETTTEEVAVAKEVDLVKGPIKLREGWGYKIGETKWRAVYDPNRKTIPKLPLRGHGGNSIEATGEEGTTTNKLPVCLFVNPHEESIDKGPPPTERSKSRSSKRVWPRPRTVRDYNQEKDEAAARAVKKCFDDRMGEVASSSSSLPSIGALIKIMTEEETAQPPQEHGYTFSKCAQTAEIVTTFPLKEVAHYQRKKYKDDHVVINTSDLNEIYATVRKIRANKRKWAQVKARAAVDQEFKEKQVAKKARAYANEKAKIAAMTKEERKLMNKRKYRSEKEKKLEKDPEQLAKQRRKEERRKAILDRDKARLEAGVDNPEERRRLQRKIRVAERTPEEKLAISKRDAEYNMKKREERKKASPEELARIEEKKRLKEEKKAALAKLTPKERVRAQQRAYEATHKAKKRARMEGEKSFRGESIPLSKRTPKKKRGKNEVEREEESMDMMDGETNDFPFGDQGDTFDENQLAVESISSPSPIRPSRHIHSHYHSHSHPYSHHHHDITEMAGPSTSRHHQERYGGDIEAEIIQLQKEVVWSERAIHNSRVEVDRLRQEATNLESAIDEELETQIERKRRIARLSAIWREDHGEDS